MTKPTPWQQTMIDVLTRPSPTPEQFARIVRRGRETPQTSRDAAQGEADLEMATRLAYDRFWREEGEPGC